MIEHEGNCYCAKCMAAFEKWSRDRESAITTCSPEGFQKALDICTPTDPTPPIDEIGSHIGNGGQFDPTDNALRLAREIADDHGCLHDADIVAAIQEGIRRASELAAEFVDTPDDCTTWGVAFASQLRNNEHLKG